MHAATHAVTRRSARWLATRIAANRPRPARGDRPREATSNLFRDRARAAARRASTSAHFDRRPPRRCRARSVVEAEGMIDLRRARSTRRLAHGRDAGGRAAAEVDHPRRRRGRRRHRGVVVPLRPRARHDRSRSRSLTGDGRIVACTPDNEHRDLFFGFPEFVRHARLRAARDGADASRCKRFVRVDARALTDRRGVLRRARAAHAPTPASISSTASYSRRDELVPDARPLRRQCAVRQRLHVRAHLLSVASREQRSTTSRRATTSGAGTPTGSGARRTSARSIRCCGGCSAASA